MFSGGSTAFGAPPNTPGECGGHRAAGRAGRSPIAARSSAPSGFGLAVGGEKLINRRSVPSPEKNYFYPIAQGYQDQPVRASIVKGGEIRILTKSGEKTVSPETRSPRRGRRQVAAREFPGRERHRSQPGGVPLLEIVSEPDMRSAEEAVAYAKALHFLIVEEIEICDGNMQEGSFRCDANVSVRRPVRARNAGRDQET